MTPKFQGLNQALIWVSNPQPPDHESDTLKIELPCWVGLLNSLPHNKILDRSKLKAFADDKLNATEKLKFVLGRVENIVGKGENAGYQHFLLFPQCFQKPSLSGSLKVGIVW